VINGRLVNGAIMGREALARAQSAKGVALGEPLRLSVPSKGIQYAFEKLYANQSPQAATFSLAYASAEGNRLGLALSLLGVVLLWLAIVAIGSRRVRMPRNAALGVLVAGVGMLLAAIGYLGASPAPAAILALIIAAGLGIRLAVQRLLEWRAVRAGN
jgi:hypothetical protein